MNETMTATIEPIEEMLQHLNVNAVFGEPRQEGDVTVIPVASVAYGFGYGAGHSGEETDPAAATGAAGGSGGGGGGAAQPQGFIRIHAGGVEYVPIVDPVRIVLAGTAMIAWSVFWITRAIRAFARN
ncbi:MAG: hypothetical protein AUK03_14855 [Anaerolineae bacterium CG2_30_64_16]|nr:MAG: hypothetical protein AUK03_14855 [Anaerolineae bacterium CG2_30_64_16]